MMPTFDHQIIRIDKRVSGSDSVLLIIMSAPAISVTFCRQFISFAAIILFLADLQCHCRLVGGGAPHVTQAGQSTTVENGRAWKNSKSRAEIFDSAAVSIRPLISTGSSVTRRRVTGYDSVNTTSRLQVEALTAFKAAIASDPMGALQTWRANDSDACGWHGVVCSRKHPKNMIALNLGGAELVGNLNSALEKVSNLRFLERLDFSHNVFSGSIPAFLRNSSHLSYLNLSYNQLSGNIPSQLGELVNIQTVDFGGNNLTGEIPVSLGNCTLLKFLNLGSNLLEGDIPSVFGRLTRLQSLRLSTNDLSGTIPASLGNCSTLAHLQLDSNTNLGGEIPGELSQLKSLQQLHLFYCSFEGALSSFTWLGNVTTLIELRLSYNHFGGQTPDWLGKLQNLRILTLGGNNFTGQIPISITNCTSLTNLGMEKNGLTGNIPTQIGFLTSLEVLYLTENSFSGVIPSTLANCSALRSLALGLNPLLDPQIIPSWIGSFSNLSELKLYRMNLHGAIPPEIGKLSNLQTLMLNNNSISGVIPLSLSNCTLLSTLQLNYNQLAGEIPVEIGLLTQLTWIQFGENFLSGALPNFFGNLTLIEVIVVEHNSFNGTIDDNFGSLSQLQQFYGKGNHFSGPIPDTISNCSSLFYFQLTGNHLTGEIPASLGNITTLEQLFVGSNMLEGTIPMGLMRCSRLGLLELSANKLEGNIPSSIGQLSSLRYLHLQNNTFTGIVPDSLGNCSQMAILDLSYNKFVGGLPGDIISRMSSSLISLNLSDNLFSGAWPPQLSELTNVQIIDVSANNISGSIRLPLGSLPALVRMDVSLNNFTGAIPQSLGSLVSLNFFNASYNNFQGPIPDSGIFKTNLTATSFLGNPGLCGTIIGAHRDCATQIDHNVAVSKSCQGFQCQQIWIPTTSALIAGALIGTGVLCWIHHEAKKRINYGSGRLLMNFASLVTYTTVTNDILGIIHGDGENVVGVGASSVVYKGALPGGEMVAVKVLRNFADREHLDDSRRTEELLKEVHNLAKLRHRNILKILSFCSTVDVKAIIFEYMPQGSLHRHLHELQDHLPKLTWLQRFNVAMGVAEAMVYLHHDFPEPLIHRDLKSSNILLDGNLEPKVGDFGLSKFADPHRDDGEVTASTICGTFGYMPPEYATGSTVSTKGDVYSYGMVLLELLTGRPTTVGDKAVSGEAQHLREWVLGSFLERPIELLDSTLQDEAMENSIKKEQMMLFMRVALICTGEATRTRPSMIEVVAMLTHIKELGLALITPKTLEVLVQANYDHESSTKYLEDSY